MHVGVAKRVELVIAYIVPGESEGNRCGLSHLATGEGSNNGRSPSGLNAIPLHPQLLVVLHFLDALFYAQVGGWAFKTIQRHACVSFIIFKWSGVGTTSSRRNCTLRGCSSYRLS